MHSSFFLYYVIKKRCLLKALAITSFDLIQIWNRERQVIHTLPTNQKLFDMKLFSNQSPYVNYMREAETCLCTKIKKKCSWRYTLLVLSLLMNKDVISKQKVKLPCSVLRDSWSDWYMATSIDCLGSFISFLNKYLWFFNKKIFFSFFLSLCF